MATVTDLQKFILLFLTPLLLPIMTSLLVSLLLLFLHKGMGEPLLLDWDPIDRPLLDGSYGSLEKISDDDSNGYSKLDPSFLPSSYSSNDVFHADSRTNSTQDHV